MTDAELLKNLTHDDRVLNSFAFRSFRDVADGDYIAARLAYRAQLPVQFLWASQQAIEKYLKCILFIRRVPAKDVGHDLESALKLIEGAGIRLNLLERSEKFIKRIDAVGRYRYMEASFWVNWHWITALDQTVWELRRFCTLDPKITSAEIVDGKWAPRVRIEGGDLEKILDAGRQNPAREPLLWHNAFYGRGRRKVTVRGSFVAVNSPLFNYPEMLDEIAKYVRVPKPVIHAYMEHARRKAKTAKKRR